MTFDPSSLFELKSGPAIEFATSIPVRADPIDGGARVTIEVPANALQESIRISAQDVDPKTIKVTYKGQPTNKFSYVHHRHIEIPTIEGPWVVEFLFITRPIIAKFEKPNAT